MADGAWWMSTSTQYAGSWWERAYSTGPLPQRSWWEYNVRAIEARTGMTVSWWISSSTVAAPSIWAPFMGSTS